MEVKVNIKYNFKDNYYHLDVEDMAGNKIPYATSRVYDNEYEAELATAILKMMYAKVEDKKDFDGNEFDFNVRATFRLLDAPGKW